MIRDSAAGNELPHPRRFWREPNLAPTEVRRQHYVPQFYLRAFAGADGRFDYVDLDTGRSRRAGPRDVAWEPNFNDVIGSGERFSTEGWLAQVEDAAAPIVKDLIEQPSKIVSLSPIDEMLLARFLAALRFRGPAFRAEVADVQAQIGSQIRRMLDHLSSQPGYQRLSGWWNENMSQPDAWLASHGKPVDVAGLAAAQLEEVTGYANLLRAMPWRIGSMPTGRRLFTSDNPLARWLNPIQVMRLGAAPFTAFEYYIPLSPTILLRIGPWRLDRETQAGETQAERVHRDFSAWDFAFALDVITTSSGRFLCGDGAFRSRKSSDENLQRIENNIVQFQYALGRKPVPSMYFPGGYDE